MKPVGLTAPDGRQPYAVVQLRQENLAKSHYNLVGFQSRMKWPEQTRVLRMLPGLEQAEIVRHGQIHRNTFVNSPTLLDARYRVKREPRLRLAGQITGVEGYLESAATGLAIALYLVLERRQGDGGEIDPVDPIGTFPATTGLGALARHITQAEAKHFQPANVNFGLFEDLGRRLPKRKRKAAYAERSRRELLAWAERAGIEADPSVFERAPTHEGTEDAAEPLPVGSAGAA
jgi:methylenetetrahydrofolate--tRNA-(uracil-5-)-methyltransferase